MRVPATIIPAANLVSMPVDLGATGQASTQGKVSSGSGAAWLIVAVLAIGLIGSSLGIFSGSKETDIYIRSTNQELCIAYSVAPSEPEQRKILTEVGRRGYRTLDQMCPPPAAKLPQVENPVSNSLPPRIELSVSETLILSSVQVETNYPRPCRQAVQAIGVGGESG